MATGKSHYVADDENFDPRTADVCRCTIGEDHDTDGNRFSEALSEWDAEDIWLSSGQDEDYDFR